jgi:hypothetical protein
VDGAERTALYLFKKAHIRDESDVSILEAMLGFSGPPEVLVSDVEAKLIAEKILKIDASNQKALKVIEK